MYSTYGAVMPITNRPDIVFVAGKGSYLSDQHGRKYLDFIQGWAVNCLGHSHPRLVDTLQQQAERLINASPAYYNQPMLELAHLLATNSAFDHVFFANSGAEANEGAIKLARKWGRLYKNNAFKIITFENGFHGRTLATMSASGKAGWDQIFEPKVPGFCKVSFNSLNAVADAIDADTVAIMLEPIQGEAGVIPASPEFLAGLQQLKQQHDLLLILDEIQTGIGRTGKLFCYQHFDIEPDILTLGKGLGGGVPLAALLAKQAISCFAPGDQGGTFNGNPLMTACGVTVIRTITEPGFLQRVSQQSQLLQQQLTLLSEKHDLGPVRGQGLLLALDTANIDAQRIAEQALQKQLLLNAPRVNTLRFMPSLLVSADEIKQMIEILDQILTSL